MVAVPEWVDALNTAVSIHHPESAEVVYANPAFGDLLGYQPSEIEAMEVGEFSSESFSNTEAAQRIRAAAAGEPQQFEWRERTSSGEVVWTEVQLSRMPTDSGKYVIAIVTPLTKYKESRRRVKFLTRAIRHDLRNHLQIIDGIVDILSMEGVDDQRTDRLQNSVDHLLRLCDRLNDLRQVSTDTPRTPTNIGDIAVNVVEPYREEYPDVDWDIDHTDVQLMANRALEIAIDELVDNAVRHNPHDELEISIIVTEDPAENQAHVRIVDTGHPVPSTEIDPITCEYDPEPLSHGEGTGLWLVQSIVTALYGRLSVPENSADRTVFEICLPRAPASTES
jgi:PAS domain S-box-containing protein